MKSKAFFIWFTNNSAHTWLLTLTLLATGSSALAQNTCRGGSCSGGGDSCENRIQQIRDEIKSWISQGGHQDLELPAGVKPEDYVKGMTTAIQELSFSCVSRKLEINGSEKTCINFVDKVNGPVALCNIERFMRQTSESDQYVLIHHEFAGFAQLEKNQGRDSDYQISRQLTGNLQDTVVKKLVVKRRPPVQVDPGDMYAGMDCAAHYPELARRLFARMAQGASETVKRVIVNQFEMAGQRISREAIRLPISSSFKVTDESGRPTDWNDFTNGGRQSRLVGPLRYAQYYFDVNVDNGRNPVQFQVEIEPRIFLSGSEIKGNFDALGVLLGYTRTCRVHTTYGQRLYLRNLQSPVPFLYEDFMVPAPPGAYSLSRFSEDLELRSEVRR